MTATPTPAPITAPYMGSIEKLFQNEYWVNNYYIDAPDIDAANAVLTSIYNAERAVHYNTITFTKMSVRTNVQNDYVYKTTTLNAAGQASPTEGFAPLYTTVRVDFTAEFGRPSRKYLRGCLTEADVDHINITDARIAAIQTGYANVLGALTGYVDGQQTNLIAGTVARQHSNRQLRRGSKKKKDQSSTTTP